MDEKQVKYDEFGIPIKQVQSTKQEVDEFGIPIKKKESTETTSQDLPTVSEDQLVTGEKSTPSTSDWKETLVKERKTDFQKEPTQSKLLAKYVEEANLPTEPVLPDTEILDIEAESRKKISDGYIQMRQKYGWTGKPQQQWSGKERKLVREYNNALNEASSLLQEDNVGEFLNAIKTDYQKGLTALDDLEKNKKIAEQTKGKLAQVLRLREEINSKGIYYGNNIELIQDDPLANYTESEKNQLRFLTKSTGSSLLGKIAMLQLPKDMQEKFGQENIDIDKYYTPEKWEELASTGLSFGIDGIIFSGLGSLSGLGARAATSGIYRSATNAMTKELLKMGVKRELAQGIAANAFSNTIKGKLAEMATSGLASGGTLASYDAINNVADQFVKANAEGEDLENFAWRETLKEGGVGFLTGFSTGVVSPLFSRAERVVDRMVSNELAKGAISKGVQGLGFGTEATLFATTPALLEGRLPSLDEITESAIMLGVIKGSMIPQSMVGKVNVSKSKPTKYEDIEYTQREIEQLGINDGSPKDIRNQISNLSNERIKEIAADKNIPMVTKYRILMNQGGVAPVGSLAIDDLTVKKEGDKYLVQTFTKNSKGENELWSEHETVSEVEANEVVRTGKQNIYEERVRAFMYNADPQLKTEVQSKLEELKEGEQQKMLEAWDTPLQLRTSEQTREVNKLLNLLNESTGGVTGTNAYNNKLDYKGQEIKETKTPTEVTVTPEVKTEVKDTQQGIKTEETKEIIPEEVKKEQKLINNALGNDRYNVNEDGTVLNTVDGFVYKLIEPPKNKEGKVDVATGREPIKTNDKSLDGVPLTKDMETVDFVYQELQKTPKEGAPKKPEIEDFKSLPREKMFEAYTDALNEWEIKYTEMKPTGEGKKKITKKSPVFEYDSEYQGQSKQEIEYKKIVQVAENKELIDAKEATKEVKDEIIQEGTEAFPPVPDATKKSLTLYHGTPFKFDKFDANKIGTGEGAQAFGHGLYFTELKDIAQWYADKLSRPSTEGLTLIDIEKYFGKVSKQERYIYEDLLDEINSNGLEEGIQNFKDKYSDAPEGVVSKATMNKIDKLSTSSFGLKKQKYLYKVSAIKKGEFDWLNWDESLNDKQIERIKETANMLGVDISDILSNSKGKKGDIIYKMLSEKLGGNAEASDFLRISNIDGIKYPAESKASEDARGFNYVIFDQNMLKIEEINGIKQQLDKDIKDGITTTERIDAIANADAKIISKLEGTIESLETKAQTAKSDAERQKIIDEIDKSIGEIQTKDTKQEIEETTEKEKTLAFSAGLDEISASFDVPDMGVKEGKQIQKDKQKEASNKLVQFVNDNTDGLKNVSSTIKDHLIKEASKVTPQNKSWKIKHFKRIIENADYAKKVEDAIIARGTLKNQKIWDRIKNKREDYEWLEDDVKMAKRLTRNGSSFKAWLNNVDMSTLYTVDGRELVSLYTEAINGLNRKGTPDFTKLKEFEREYKHVIDLTIDDNLANPTYKDVELYKDKYSTTEIQANEVDKFLNRAEKIQSLLDQYNDGKKISAEDVKSLKREASSLYRLAESYVKNGLISEENGQAISQDPRFKFLADIYNESKETLENVSKEIKDIETKQKNDALTDAASFISDKLIKDQEYKEDAEMLKDVSNGLKEIKKNPKALEYLSSYDSEYLRDALEQVKKNDIVPTNLYQLRLKINTAIKTSKIETESLDGLDKVRAANERVKKFTDKSKGDLQRYLDASPSWKMGELFEMVDMVGKATNNPIYNDILYGTEAAILKAKTLHEKEMNEVYDIAIKMHKPKTMVGKVAQELIGSRMMNKAAKVSTSRIGILMGQVNFANLLNEGNTVIFENNKFYVENLKGEKIKEGDKYKEFDKEEDARKWAISNKDKVIGEDNFDLYHLLNRGAYKIERRDAKFHRSEAANNKEKAYFDEAYDSMTDKGKKRLLISNDAEALKLLTKEEGDLYKRLRKGFQKFQGDASAVAAAEGLSLKLRPESYYPNRVVSRQNMDIDANELINSISMSNEKGGLPQVTGSIYKKTNAIKYIDFDAVRVYDKYVNELMVSRHVLPEARTQLGSFDNLIKKFRNEYKKTGNEQWRLDFTEAVKDDYLMRMKTNYEQKGIGGAGIRLDNAYRMITKAAIHDAMQKWDRVPRDIIPNSAQFRIAPWKLFWKQSTNPEWEYFTNDNPDSLLALSAEEMANKASLGTGNERVPYNKGKIQQWADMHIKIGDAWSMREGYIKFFKSEYKARTGEEFDAKRYATDEVYREEVKNSNDFNEAKAAAHWRTSRISTPQTAFAAKMYPAFWLSQPFMQRNKLIGQLNSPLTQYSQNQAARWWQNWKNVVHDSNEGKVEGRKQLANQFLGELTYNMMAQGSLAITKYAMAVLKDDEDWKAYYLDNMGNMYKDPRTYLASGLNSALSLSIGGYGNLGRMLFSALYSAAFDVPALTELKAERYKIKQLKEEFSPAFKGSINASFDVTSNYAKKADTYGMFIPVYGAYGSKLVSHAGEIYQDAKSVLYNKIDGDPAFKDVNAAHFLNSIASIAALRVQYPAMSTANQILKTLGDEKEIKPKSYDALRSESITKYLQVLSQQADEIITEKGEQAGREYLENWRGDYEKSYQFYKDGENKQFIDFVSKYTDAITDLDMSYTDKKPLWSELYKVAKFIDERHKAILATPKENLTESDYRQDWNDYQQTLYDIQIKVGEHIADKLLKKDVKEILDKNKEMFYLNLVQELNEVNLDEPSK